MKILQDQDRVCYKRITHAQRLDIIYKRLVHLASVRRMSRERGLAENTIRNILRAYNDCGRTNKKVYRRGKVVHLSTMNVDSLKGKIEKPSKLSPSSKGIKRIGPINERKCELQLLVSPFKMGVANQTSLTKQLKSNQSKPIASDRPNGLVADSSQSDFPASSFVFNTFAGQQELIAG